MTPLNPETPIPALTPPPRRPEELHGSRLLRDAAAAENAVTGDSDTASQGIGQGQGDRVGWGVLQARKGLGGMQEWIGASSKPVRGWEGREMDLG